jgi:outer membrane protein|tara:strand:+ start:290 stop:805 length:516 start_codon:yes stop_codon:yes gene_type:complete
MKQAILIFSIIFTLGYSSQAQKFVYVNSEIILESIPGYVEAQDELDKLSKKWQAEIEGKYSEIEKLYQAYKAEKILLTEELKKKRELEITELEKEVRLFQKQKFGVNGALFKARQKLIKPLQDKIYDALKDMADRNNYSVVMDLASSSNILYSNTRYDKTEFIIKKVGKSK